MWSNGHPDGLGVVGAPARSFLGPI